MCINGGGKAIGLGMNVKKVRILCASSVHAHQHLDDSCTQTLTAQVGVIHLEANIRVVMVVNNTSFSKETIVP